MVSVDLVEFLHTRMVSVSNIFRRQTLVFLSSCQVVTAGSCCHVQAITELDTSETNVIRKLKDLNEIIQL